MGNPEVAEEGVMEIKTRITPEIQKLLGREDVFQASEPVDTGKIRRFAKSLGFDNPEYLDLQKGKPLAPPTFVFSVNHDSLDEVDETGRPARRLSLPPPFGPPMRGGNLYQFFQPVRVGDLITIRRKVTDLKEKEGRTGTLVFLTYEVKYTNQRGELLGINTETLIFRLTASSRGDQ